MQYRQIPLGVGAYNLQLVSALHRRSGYVRLKRTIESFPNTHECNNLNGSSAKDKQRYANTIPQAHPKLIARKIITILNTFYDKKTKAQNLGGEVA